MKKSFTFLFLFTAFSSATFAQVPNGGFESWNGTEPLEWFTNNDAATLNGQVAASMGTPAPEGNSYLNLTSFFDASQGMPTGAVAICGTVEILPTTANIFGFPYGLRPDYLTGVYQYQASSDMGYGVCMFTKWNATTNSRDTVGTGNIIFSNATTWTNFNIFINYTLPQFPDSCILGFVSSMNFPSEIGSSLSIDNLQLTNTPASTPEIQIADEWSLYPNPAKDHLNFQLPANVSYPIYATITDVSGRLVKQETIYSVVQSQLNLSELKKGMYVIQLKSNQQRFVKSFVKN